MGRSGLWLWGLLCCAAAYAQGPNVVTPPAGEYLAQRGWGVLLVQPGRNGRSTFSLEAMGGNMHSCSLEGAIEGGRAVLEGDSRDRSCVVSFVPRGHDFDVQSNGACRNYCGARAGFEQVYVNPAPGCARREVRRSREDFKRLYDRKAYAEARTRLEPLLGSCAQTLWWPDEGWIRNDLALTLHRLGDHAGCLALLQKFVDLAAQPDAEVLAGYPPSDGETMLPIVKAARTNLGLCRAALAAPGGRAR